MAPNSDLLKALEKLRDAVSQLPASTPFGPSAGIVGRNFSAQSLRDGDGSVWEKVDRAYTRCFSVVPSSNPDPRELILKGPSGMDLVVGYFESVAGLANLKSQDLFLIELKLNQLTDLVYARIKSLPPDDGPSRAKKAQQRQRARHAAQQHPPFAKTKDVYRSEDDSDYNPAADPVSASSAGDLEGDSNANTAETTAPGVLPTPPNTADGTSRNQPSHKRRGSLSLSEKRPAKKKRTSNKHPPVSSPLGSDADNESDALAVKSKKKGLKKAWALTHYTEPVAGINPSTGGKVWVFYCQYCAAMRRIARSDGCEEFSAEPKPFAASNFTSHLHECEDMPAHEKWDAVVARRKGGKSPTVASDQSGLGAMFTAPVEMVHAQGQNTSAALQTSAFRSELIQGVIRDNYPLTFGEGPGMTAVFNLINPHIKLPSHQTMRRDLDMLFEVLSKRVRHVMESQTSRFAIASDAWSSKSSVYTFAGIVVSFIDNNWTLHQFPIDLIHLNAEHSGVPVGRKVFKAIERCGVAESLISSVTDNASANRTMNEEIARRFTDRFGQDLDVDTMMVTCVAHSVHLICSEMLSNLGAMEPLDNDQAYSEAKAFDPGELYENNQDALEEQERFENEGSSEDEDPLPGVPDDSSEPSGSDTELEPKGGVQGAATGNDNRPGTSSRSTKQQKVLNVLEKIHAIAVHCTGSPKRRKRMRRITRKLCKQLKVMIKSMGIRWNSVLAEIRRALLLKPAVNQWVLTLDEGLTGRDQKAARARKQKWTISDSEWDLLSLLVKLLEPFERATLSFSKRNIESGLPAVLPTYLDLLATLDSALKQLDKEHPGDLSGIKNAVSLGRIKLIKYVKTAQKSDLTVIALMLHPRLRFTRFDDFAIWGDITHRGHVLLEHLYNVYATDYAEQIPESAKPGDDSQSPDEGSWMDHLMAQTSIERQTGSTEELHDYFADKYPLKKGTDLLAWWKEHSKYLPVLGRVAQDILCVPASSVSVERLFSQCRLVMTDNRNMSVETARRIITCQHWLKAGLGTNLPDFISCKR